MKPASCALAGCLNIFLLLSMHPITAMRISRQDIMIKESEDLQSTVQELQQALQEDTQNVTSGQERWPWDTCDSLKKDFERRTVKVRDRYIDLQQEKGLKKAVGTLLKARRMSKTLAAAEKKGCAWAKEKAGEKVDTSALQDLAARDNNPCKKVAEDTLSNAKDASSQLQGQALVSALGILISDDCKPVAMPASAKDVNPKDAQKMLEKMDANDLDDLDNKLATKTDLAPEALLQVEGFNVSEVKTLTQDHSPASVASAFVEVVSRLEQGERSRGFEVLGEIIFKVVGWIILCILFILFCYVILFVMVLILGLIMCTIKAIIVACLKFISLFGIKSEKSWSEVNYLKCVTWWLSGLGHMGSGGESVGIAICAISMMAR